LRAAQAATTTGVYTSPVKDFTTAVNLETISWVATTPPSTSVAIRARVCVDATCSTNPAWSTVPNSGDSLPSSFNNNRYFQYEITLSSTDDYAAPTVTEVSVGLGGLIGVLTSSAFDTVNATNTIGSVNWTASGISASETVKLRIRTAPDDGGVPGLWSGWCGPANCSGSDYFSSGQAITNPALQSGANDQWIQYEATLESGGALSPMLTEVTIGHSEANYDFTLSYSPLLMEVVANQSARVGSVMVNPGTVVGVDRDAIISDSTNFTSTQAGISFSPASCLPNSGPCTVDVYAQIGTAGSYTMVIQGNNASGSYPNGITHTISFTLDVIPPITYDLSLSSSSDTIIKGLDTTQSILTITHNSGADEFVSITSSGVPAGVTVSFSLAPTGCSPYPSTCSITIAFSATSTTTSGVYPIVFSGVSSISGTTPVAPVTFTLGVSELFDFAMAYGPPNAPCTQSSSCSVEQGQSITVTADLTSVTTIGEQVTLTAEGLPWTPAIATGTSCTPSSGAPCSVQVVISPPLSVAQNNYTISLVGRSATKAKSLTYALTVTEGFQYSLVLNSSGGTVVRNGASASVLVDVIFRAGLTSKPVTLTVSGMNGFGTSGVSTSYLPDPPGATCTPNCQIQVVFSAPSSSVLGTYDLTIQGSGNGTDVTSPPAMYQLKVVDPFDFAFALSLSSDSMMVGDPPVSAVAFAGWTQGGDGSDVISLTSSVSPTPSTGTLAVSFSPTCGPGGCIVGLNSTTPTCLSDINITYPAVINGKPCLASTVTFTPSTSPALTSGNYTVTLIATCSSPTCAVIRTATFYLTVGTNLNFTVTASPASERVSTLPGSTGPVALTATLNAPAQPSTSDIVFSLDTGYVLPAGVTVCEEGASCSAGLTSASSCTLGATVGSTCSAPPITFSVAATASPGSYNIPIIGTSGLAKSIPALYLLKVGTFTLTAYTSSNLYTDPHQRPVVNFTWDPLSPFAGKSATFNAIDPAASVRPSAAFPNDPPAPGGESKVYVAGVSSGTNADQVLNAANATLLWNFGCASCTPVTSTQLNSPVSFNTSGRFSPRLSVTDNAGNVCYSITGSDATADNPCYCPLQLSADSMIVSKPPPTFREIKP